MSYFESNTIQSMQTTPIYLLAMYVYIIKHSAKQSSAQYPRDYAHTFFQSEHQLTPTYRDFFETYTRGQPPSNSHAFGSICHCFTLPVISRNYPEEHHPVARGCLRFAN